jgi:hypothetical protein
MKFKTYKIQLKLVRSFSIGFAIFSPRLNSAYIEFHLGCFHLALWSKGENLIGFKSYWNGQ